VLLARGCAADRIILLCIIAAPEGIARICSRWPGVRLVCSDIDDHVDSEFNVVPGCGEFGDR
jgi:uridine kinase